MQAKTPKLGVFAGFSKAMKVLQPQQSKLALEIRRDQLKE